MTEFARCPAFNIECQYVTEVDRLSAENERLREVLIDIANGAVSLPKWAEAMARAALGERHLK